MNRAYIKQTIDPILEPIVTEIFMKQPEDQVTYPSFNYYLGLIHAKLSHLSSW